MAASFPLCCATSSLNPFPADREGSHDLNSKLRAIAGAGFAAIELAFPDLLSYANQHLGKDVAEDAWDDLCATAQEVRKTCQELELEVLMLQPFAHLEGWEKGSPERGDAFRRAEGWIRIMEAVGTKMLQVGSTDAPNITMDYDRLADDLAALADLLAPHGFQLAYENWCWATAAPTWRDAYELVVRADRPNVGLCLDTFQTAGYEWGDPTAASGRADEDGDLLPAELEERYGGSLAQLAAVVHPEKIFLLQVSDAYRPPEPLSAEPDASGMRPRARWSAAFRPMPGKAGGYLPVVEMARAVAKTGFRGYLSVEIFDGGPDGKGREKGDLAREAAEIMGLARKFADSLEV